MYRPLFRRVPEAREEAVDLTSFDPPASRRFVLRQRELMDSGVPRSEAFALARKELQGQFPGRKEASALATAQAEEEEAIRRAVLKFRQDHPDFVQPTYRARRARAPGGAQGGAAASPAARDDADDGPSPEDDESLHEEDQVAKFVPKKK